MPWALVKNNFKLMLRNKWVIVLMIVGPIVVIAALSSAFKEMMKGYAPVGDFVAGYCTEPGSNWEESVPAIKEAAKNNGIELREFNPEDTSVTTMVEKIFRQKDAAVFVEFKQGSYHIYKQKGEETEAGVLEYFLYQAIHSLGQTENNNGITREVQIRVFDFPAAPRPDSKDYYGIIEIVYFSWCSVIIMSPVFSSEKKNRITPRLKASPLSNISLFIGKALPCIVFTMLLTLISALVSTILFDIKWGSLPVTLLVMALSIIASSLFSIFIYNLLQNMAVTVGVIFTLVWIAGFLGGSFETYMFSTTPEHIKDLSPLYYINRTLVEYSTAGSSAYLLRCLIYLAVISIVSFIFGLLLADGRGKKNQ